MIQESSSNEAGKPSSFPRIHFELKTPCSRLNLSFSNMKIDYSVKANSKFSSKYYLSAWWIASFSSPRISRLWSDRSRVKAERLFNCKLRAINQNLQQWRRIGFANFDCAFQIFFHSLKLLEIELLFLNERIFHFTWDIDAFFLVFILCVVRGEIRGIFSRSQRQILHLQSARAVFFSRRSNWSELCNCRTREEFVNETRMSELT